MYGMNRESDRLRPGTKTLDRVARPGERGRGLATSLEAARGWSCLGPGRGSKAGREPQELGPIPPMINIALLSVILVARWRRRWRPGAHTADP